MDFRILGPFEVRGDDAIVHVGGPKVKALLATLVLHGNQPVSVKTLVESVWDRDSSLVSSTTVYSHVCRLRSRLASASVDGENRIITDTNGYRLKVKPNESDVERFRVELEHALASATIGLLEEADEALGRALALWRGPALLDVPGKIAGIEAVNLNETRLIAEEKKLEIGLALDRHVELAPTIRKMLLQHPLRERLAALLMQALYRSGQQAEALQVYRSIRQALVEELAVEPGPELQRLHQGILNHDLELTSQRGYLGAGVHGLPIDSVEFTGRAAEIRRIVEMAGKNKQSNNTPVIATMSGMAGVGKTTLAVHVSHMLADYYPDGQLFLNLNGHTLNGRPKEPTDALAELIESVGVPAVLTPATLEQRVVKWRSLMADRQAIIVLDDVASTEQVLPLLPGISRSLVLITSRNRLFGLPATYTVSLTPLPLADAMALLTAMLAADRVVAEPEAVEKVVELCGRLPLAIYLAAERLRHRPTWGLTEIIRQLEFDRLRIAESNLGQNRLVGKFNASYMRLRPEEQRVFRSLGIQQNCAPDVITAAEISGFKEADAELVLESLVDANMLEMPSAGQYRVHELLSAYIDHIRAADEFPGFDGKPCQVATTDQATVEVAC